MIWIQSIDLPKFIRSLCVHNYIYNADSNFFSGLPSPVSWLNHRNSFWNTPSSQIQAVVEEGGYRYSSFHVTRGFDITTMFDDRSDTGEPASRFLHVDGVFPTNSASFSSRRGFAGLAPSCDWSGKWEIVRERRWRNFCYLEIYSWRKMKRKGNSAVWSETLESVNIDPSMTPLRPATIPSCVISVWCRSGISLL